MSPRNSDFPDYKGISVSHADDWNALDFNNRQGKYAKQPDPGKADNGFKEVGGMVSPRTRRVHTPQASQDVLDKTAQLARQKWREMGISNSTIQDN